MWKVDQRYNYFKASAIHATLPTSCLPGAMWLNRTTSCSACTILWPFSSCTSTRQEQTKCEHWGLERAMGRRRWTMSSTLKSCLPGKRSTGRRGYTWGRHRAGRRRRWRTESHSSVRRRPPLPLLMAQPPFMATICTDKGVLLIQKAIPCINTHWHLPRRSSKLAMNHMPIYYK